MYILETVPDLVDVSSVTAKIVKLHLKLETQSYTEQEICPDGITKNAGTTYTWTFDGGLKVGEEKIYPTTREELERQQCILKRHKCLLQTDGEISYLSPAMPAIKIAVGKIIHSLFEARKVTMCGYQDIHLQIFTFEPMPHDAISQLFKELKKLGQMPYWMLYNPRSDTYIGQNYLSLYFMPHGPEAYLEYVRFKNEKSVTLMERCRAFIAKHFPSFFNFKWSNV